MKAKVSCRDIDRIETDALVLLFFRDERPLRSSSGIVDWRMNGEISKLIIDKRIGGEKGESVLIVPNRRIKARMILMMGLGESSSFRGDDLIRISSEAMKKLLKINVKSLAIALPYAGFTSLETSQCLSLVTIGVTDSIKSGQGPPEDIAVTFVVETTELAEAASVIQRTDREMANRFTMVKDDAMQLTAAS